MIFVLLLAICTLTVTQQPRQYFAIVEVEVPIHPGGLTLSFLLHGRPTLESCETISGNISRVALSGCKQCRIKLVQCLNILDEMQRFQLTTGPLPVPSGSFANGVVVFNATTPEIALIACQTSQQQSALGSHSIQCFRPYTPRNRVTATAPLVINLWSIIIFLATFVVAWIGGWLILTYDHLHSHLSHDQVGSGPQKYHTQPTPRIGGVVVMGGLLVAGCIIFFVDTFLVSREFGLLLLACMPAFFGGLVEDLTKKAGVIERLALTMLSGAIAAWLLGTVINRLHVPGVDQLLQWLPFAVIFTCFAVGGIANAINIIDGYNGLASGFSIIVLSAFLYVAYLVGDQLVFMITISTIAALLGFFVWNWPSGRIFLGDSGAYLIGFVMAEIAILLVARHPEVSPWFPLLLLIYPVFETFFSVYRRKVTQGTPSMLPDNLHMHQLIHDNVVLHSHWADSKFDILKANSRVAKYLWVHAIATVVLGSVFWQSTMTLIFLIIAYCVIYILVYHWIAHRKVAKAGSNEGRMP